MNLCSLRLLSSSRTRLALVAQQKKRPESSVFGCGLSASGALAIPALVVQNKCVTSREVHKVVRIQFCNKHEIQMVACGFGFSLFASRKKLYGSGLNNRLQVAGRLTKESNSVDYYISGRKIGGLPRDGCIRGVSAGRAHSLVVIDDRVYAFGDNTFGQCGIDPSMRSEVVASEDEALPEVAIPSSSPPLSVHCALDTSFILTEAGEVFAFGLNEDGQCGSGQSSIESRPFRVSGDLEGEKIQSIHGSSDTIFAISKNGEVFIWGQNSHNQGGSALSSHLQLRFPRCLPFSLPKILSAAVSATSCVLLTTEREELSWGVGVLGFGPDVVELNRPALLAPSLFHDTRIQLLFGGHSCTAAVNEKGETFVWGRNRFGMLCLGHLNDQLFPLPLFLSLPGMFLNAFIRMVIFSCKCRGEKRIGLTICENEGMSEMAEVVRAAGVVVYRRAAAGVEFLLLQASYPPHHWTPPKGHVDPGEDEWTAALRETKEEAGIDSSQLDVHVDCHETLSYTAHGKQKTVKYWLARLKGDGDVLLSHEHQKWKWTALEDAVKIADYAEMGALLRKFSAFLNSST